MWGQCRIVSGFGRCQCPSHVTGRIRIDIIVLDGIAHDGRNTLLETLRNIVLTGGINGLNRC
ncbi:hypothetical protein D3C78_705710 [compost metagenome]